MSLHAAVELDASAWRKLDAVRSALAGSARVLVAFSGGVDSTLLAALARDVLGRERVLAVTADSPSLARADLREAIEVARQLDLTHLVIETHELEQAAYRDNDANRCFFCKRELFDELWALARSRDIPVVFYGAIGDDRPSERPGQRAAHEAGVRAPLQDVGLTKWDIRLLARALGLPNWNRPQNACLSSRIPHGRPVTIETLAHIERAEDAVRREGFRQVRVRQDGETARVEVGQDELDRVGDARLRERMADAIRACGFTRVEFDPRGYRSTGADALWRSQRICRGPTAV